jgi:hypothetical protein
MEMPFQKVRLLSASGAFIQYEVASDGESGSHRRKGLDELSSGCHQVLLN